MEKINPQKLSQLWYEYKRRNSDKAREALILYYVPLVKYTAGRLAIGLRGYFEIDDLVSAGVYGLISAIDKFDPEKGVKFETFALARIKGAIIDWLRAIDWVPHSIRAKFRDLEDTYAYLEQQLGRYPEDHEVASYKGLTMEQFYQILQEITPITIISLDDYFYNFSKIRDNSLSLGETLADPRIKEPSEFVEFKELKQTLVKAIEKLPEKERLVIALYYYNGLTLKEIGEILGLSESRICQLHTKAILRLRGYLSRKKGELM